MKKYVIGMLVTNEAGVLTRISGLFGRRGFNIESLTVGTTEDPSLSRMTVTFTGDEYTREQVIRQAFKCVDVEYIKELLSDADGFHPEGNGKRLDSKKSDEAKESKQSAPTASKPPKPAEEEEGPVAPASTSPKPLKTWADVKKFIKKNYNVADEEKDSLALDFDGCEEGRTQRVFVEKNETRDGDVWISVLSRIGLIDDSEIDQVLEELGEKCYGGLVKMGKRHFVRYAVLMDSVTEENLLVPISSIAYLADALEKEYIGGDQS